MEFYCVYARDAFAIKRYLGRVSSKSIKISYIDVYNKLTKNDVYMSEPNEMVVYSKVYTLLQKTLLTECDDKTKVYYVISELDKEMIKGLKAMIKELYAKSFSFVLIAHKDAQVQGYGNIFHEIKTFT